MKQQLNPPAVSTAKHENSVGFPDMRPAPDPILPPEEGAGATLLEDALPEITEAARKVGGFKRLAEIAAELDRAGS